MFSYKQMRLRSNKSLRKGAARKDDKTSEQQLDESSLSHKPNKLLKEGAETSEQQLDESSLGDKPLRKNPNTPLKEQELLKEKELATIVNLMMTSGFIPVSDTPAAVRPIEELREIIEPINIHQLLKIRTALSSPPTEAAQNIARKIVQRIVNYDFSGKALDSVQTGLFSLLLWLAQNAVMPPDRWHLFLALIMLPATFSVSEQFDKVREKWRRSSWRDWIYNLTAERNGADAIENASLDLMLLSDKRGTALATAHIHEVSKAIDVLLQTRIQYVKNSEKIVFNQNRESLNIKWENISFSEKVMWVASAQALKLENDKSRATLDKTKLKCDLLQSTKHNCAELVVANLVANDNAQSYALAARLINAYNASSGAVSGQ